MTQKELVIYCDGGSRGNPGPAASAYVVYDGDEKVHGDSKYLGESTNNNAEYTALLMAMQWIGDNQNKYANYKIMIIMDSQLVVRQINGIYKIRSNNLKSKATQIQKLRKQIFLDVVIAHVHRHKNTLADQLVNQKLDE